LTYWHLDLALARKTANDDRAKRIRLSEGLCLATLAVGTAEFVIAVLMLL
jgi:hypothetical protein